MPTNQKVNYQAFIIRSHIKTIYKKKDLKAYFDSAIFFQTY